MTDDTPSFLAQGSQLEGPSRPLLTSIVTCDSLWVAARFTPSTVHVFAGGTLCHIVQFPEDLCHLEFGVRSTVGATTAQLQSQDHRVCFLAVTDPCRAWLLDLSKAAVASPEGGKGAGSSERSGASMHRSAPQQKSAEGFPASSSAAQPLTVQWQVLPAQPGSAPDLPRPVRAQTNMAALLTTAAGLLGNPVGAASLAAHIAWEHLADGPSLLHGEADKPHSPSGLFLDLSGLGRKYSQQRQAVGISGCGTVWALAAACSEGTMPSLSGPTCSLHVRAHVAQNSASASQSGARDKLVCGSRASVSPRLYRALLAGGAGDTGASGGGCLLVGDFAGRVWAHPLDSKNNPQTANASKAPPLTAQNAAADDSTASPGPMLLFDIQQPVLSIHPTTTQQATCQGVHSLGGLSNDCLVVVGRGGHVVQICVRESSEPVSARPQQPQPAGAAGREPAASLAITQMRVHAPVASAAVSQGVLYYTSGGTAFAALLPSALDSPSGSSGSEPAAPQAPSRRDRWRDLQPLPLQCFGQCPHLLSVSEPCSSAADVVLSDKAATGDTAAVRGRLVMLCTSGALFEGPLLSAEVVSAVKPSLPSSKVQKEVKGLIEGINELTACKALLEPHLAAADAGLAELALSVPLAQGLRDRRNLHCWVEAAVQASGERAAPDVLLTIGLQNTGPYPVAQAWSVLIVCRAPALPGGHQTGCEMQRAIPLEGLPVGRTWRQSFTVEEMQSSSLEVSVHLCHVQQQGASERHCTSALLKTARIDILHLMRPVLFQTAYERACLPEKPEQQRTASLAVMVHALSSMPTASLLLRQILSVGVEDCLQSQGDHGSGTGALALMTSSSVTGIVSLGCKSATLSIHAALQSTSATTPRARLELTLKCSDVTVLAAAHESVSWRLQEWQRMLPGVGPDESKGDRKALLERAQADLRELQRIATALQEAGKGVKQLRQLADRGSGLHSEGLAFQALQRRSLSLRAGLGHAYLKLRSISAALPYSVTLQ